MLLVIQGFAQFVYPDPPKSTNDATIIGKLNYPHHFKYEGNPVSRMHGAADPDVQVWGNGISGIDPKVFIDDDGQAYLYNNSAVVAKLKPNMIGWQNLHEKLYMVRMRL